MPDIKKMVNVPAWELQGQLLILSDVALQELCLDRTKMRGSEEDQGINETLPRIAQSYT